MSAAATIKDLVSARYSELTQGLQQAADYVVENPIEVATQSLRSVATSSGMSPATFSRLSRALGLKNHEEVRSLCRQALTPQGMSFARKARELQSQADKGSGLGALFFQQAAANVKNIEELVSTIDIGKTERVVERLAQARQVQVLAGSTSQGVAKYLNETAGWISDRWRLVEDRSTSLSLAVSSAAEGDVLILISKSLFTAEPVRAARLAAEKGAYVVVITDSHTCPALSFADEYFVLSLDSPYFFPSYAPTMVLLEAMIGMLAARLGPAAEERIKQTEANSRRLGTYWEQPGKAPD